MPALRYNRTAPLLLAIAGLAVLSQISYLLFHTTVEVAGVVVSLGMFTLAWNLRRTLDNNYLLVMGIAACALGVLDLLHMLAFKGMNIFPGYDANLPTQLHIAGRYLQAATMLAAPFFLGRKVRVWPAVLTCALAAGALVAAIFAGVFPDCYIEGAGLTLFKKTSEYLISLVMAGGIGLLWLRRGKMDAGVLRLLVGAGALTIVGELSFTLYVGVYDWLNMAGHLVRLVSVYLLYRALVETGLTRPVDLLFWNLKRSEEALAHERNFVGRVLDMAGAPMLVTDPQGRILRFNRACEELTGFSAQEATGRILWELLVLREEQEAARTLFAQLQESRADVHTEYHWATKHGERRLMACANTPLRGADGHLEYVVCTGADVTTQRQLEHELKEREERLRVMVESVQTGMLLIDRNTHTVVNANPAVAALIGLSPRELTGRPCSDFIQCGSQENCPFDRGEAPSEAMLKTASGRLMPVHRTVASVTTDGREQLLESVVDMTEHKRLEEELRALSMVDELTGLYNRRGFLTLAPREIDAAARVRGGMVLLFIDVDNLKEINDRHGHAEGDRALIAMARVLREAYREAGLIARTGADEFAVLVPHFVGSPALLVNRLVEQLEAYNCAVRGAYELRAAIGHARYNPDHPCTASELLNQADNMLYLERRRRLSR